MYPFEIDTPHASSWMDVVMYLIYVGAPLVSAYFAMKANTNAKAAQQVAQETHMTLTEKNGGSTAKDQLDRIEHAVNGGSDNDSVTEGVSQTQNPPA